MSQPSSGKINIKRVGRISTINLELMHVAYDTDSYVSARALLSTLSMQIANYTLENTHSMWSVRSVRLTFCRTQYAAWYTHTQLLRFLKHNHQHFHQINMAHEKFMLSNANSNWNSCSNNNNNLTLDTISLKCNYNHNEILRSLVSWNKLSWIRFGLGWHVVDVNAGWHI